MTTKNDTIGRICKIEEGDEGSVILVVHVPVPVYPTRPRDMNSQSGEKANYEKEKEEYKEAIERFRAVHLGHINFSYMKNVK